MLASRWILVKPACTKARTQSSAAGAWGAVVVEAGRQVMAERSLEKLVIVADDDSDGLRLYTSLGFQPAERQIGLVMW
jgi:hypothetical protein